MEQELAKRRITAENSFNELTKQKEQKEQEIRDIDTELVRLQGEYRLIDDLLKKSADPMVSPEPGVIDVTSAAKGRKK